MSNLYSSLLHTAQSLSTTTFSLAQTALVTVGGGALELGGSRGGKGDGWLGRVLERGLVRVMQKQIKYGSLTLILPSGKSHTFGPHSPAHLHPHSHSLASSSSSSVLGSSASSASLASGSGSGSGGYAGSEGSRYVSGESTPSLGAGGRNLVGEGEVNSQVGQGQGLGLQVDPTEPTPNVTITINSSTFFLRLLLSGDLGFAEAYMAGECDVAITAGVESVPGGEVVGGGEGQRLEEGYYGSAVGGEEWGKGWREGEELFELFRIAIRSDHPGQASSLSTYQSSSTSSSSSGVAGGLNSLPATIFSTLGNLTTSSRIVNSVRNSVGNIRAHYDISNRMFASFLSADMTYSCAIFPELDSDLSTHPHPESTFNPAYLPSSYPSPPSSTHSTDALERAQYAKLHHIIRKAKIQRGHRVLEIGSGWGSMAIEAVRLTGCTVDTLTLSTQQKVLAEERIREAGLEGSIRVHLMDFRSIPESWKHTYDRLVSVEMLEAVGKDFIEPYFKMIDEVLNEEGVAVFQVITIPESRFETYSNSVDFIQKWIFPGGFLPSVAYTSEMISKGSNNRLTIDSIVNIGPHYARTLREWRIRFLKSFDRDIRPALKDEHPEMTEADVEVFKRKWIYYFVYCEVGFSERLIGDHIFCLTREGNRKFGSDVFA